MPDRDVFALDPSGFNGFLFAAIGTESDGSLLTVLSTLARLELDPWATAASWARMSKAASGAALAAMIAQMPVSAEDRLAAGATAARLVQLLSPAGSPAPRSLGGAEPSAKPRLVQAVAVIALMALLLGSAVLVFKQGAQAVGPPSSPGAPAAP